MGPLCKSVADSLDLSRKPPPHWSIYVLFCGDEIVYVGASIKYHNRIAAHKSKKFLGNREGAKTFDRYYVYPMHCYECARLTETDLIRRHQPRYNFIHTEKARRSSSLGTQQVLTMLNSFSGVATVGEIGLKIGKGKQSTWKALNDLIRAGLVNKPARGKYEVHPLCRR